MMRIMVQYMNSYPRAVVALAGARDQYQLPLALHEGELLEALVTDMYWPAERTWFAPFSRYILPQHLVTARYRAGIDSRHVVISPTALAASITMRMTRTSRVNRFKDKALSKAAKRVAVKTGAALFCYSYYAFDAFQQAPDLPFYRFIFQVHPHPCTIRRIFQEESELVPQAKASLHLEHELSLSPQEFHGLASEPHRANGWAVASSYTARTLAEHGIPYEKIHIVPYGVNSEAFPCRPTSPSQNRPFTIIFVGSMIQRKGLSYLLDAVKLLKYKAVRIILCGRGTIDKDLLAHYSDLDLDLKLGLPYEQLIQQLWRSDLFVFPSLIEGFAHVVLEAMSCGLPIMTTENTCGPDVLEEGTHGFIVPIRNAQAIAERLEWGICHRSQLAEMGRISATQARLFTWERFRTGIREAYIRMISAVDGLS